MSEANKSLGRRIMEEIWNQKNPALIDEFYAANYVSHTSDGVLRGREGLREIYNTYVTAFPDCRIKIEDITAEGERVVARYTFRGTHTGELMGIVPSGNEITATGIVIWRIVGGKVVADWVVWDRLSLMEQLGLAAPVTRIKEQGAL